MNAINSAMRMKRIEQFENLHLNEYVILVTELEQLRQRVAELEKERDKATQYWQIAEGRCDALVKQRDELLAALTYVIEDLELRASLKLDEDERDVVDIGNGAYMQAKEALAATERSE